MRRSSAACVETDCGEGGGPPRRISAAGVETAAREAGHSGGRQLQASRPRRGRRATAADLGRRRRDRGEGGGERGGARSPVSRPPRGQRCQRAEDFLDAKTQRSVSLKIQMLYYVKGSHIVYHMIFTGLIFVEINFQG